MTQAVDVNYNIPSGVKEQMIKEGILIPPRVMNNKPERILYFISSADATMKQSNYNFTVTCGAELHSCVKANISRVQLIKIPNVNPANNTVTINHTTAGILTFNLTPGYYNVNGLINELKYQIDLALAGADIMVFTYNTKLRNITITSSSGIQWYFMPCHFITRGQYLTGFQSSTAFSSTSQISAVCTMLYSRYLQISSNRLIQNAYESGRTSAQRNYVITVVSLAGSISSFDFNSTDDYGGGLIIDESVSKSSALLNVASNRGLSFIDFTITDEYGLDLSYPLSGAPDSSGILIWLDIYI